MTAAERKAELLQVVKELDVPIQKSVSELLNRIVFLEEQLINLEKLPFIRVNPKNKAQQISTPASKQYVTLLQQYGAALKVLLKLTANVSEGEDSPLRAYLNKMKEEYDAP